jgi:multiple sugar transport system ATP-binding protein
VTHDQVEALTLGHRVGVMNQGRIQQVDAPMVLYEHPANLFVAGFIGSPPMNFFDGTLVEKGTALLFEETPSSHPDMPKPFSLRLDDSVKPRLRSCLGKPIILGIRPESIACTPAPRGASPNPSLEAVVEIVQPAGAETYLYLAGHSRPIVARVPAACSAVRNQIFALTFDVSRCHLFDRASGSALL